MSLRNRLFLWVGALFLMSALCSTVVQYVVTKRALKKAQAELCHKMMSSKEDVRGSLQKFLSNQIVDDQAKVDVLLANITQSQAQLARFAPTTHNYVNGTWSACSDLLDNNSDIDFIQNTNEGISTATIIPQNPPFHHALRIPIDEELSWVYFEHTATTDEVMIGVRLFNSYQAHLAQNANDEVIEESVRSLPDVYLLYPWHTLAANNTTMDKPDLQPPPFLSPPWMQGHDISLQTFFRSLERARLALQNGTLVPPEMQERELQKKIDGEAQWEQVLLNPFSNEKTKGKVLSERFLLERANAISLRNGEINILWMLLSMHQAGFTGDSVFTFPAPSAVSAFRNNYCAGPAIHVRSVLFASKPFEDAEYFERNAPQRADSNLANSMAIIIPESQDRVFLGNTAQFKVMMPSQQRLGYLTLACDADEILDEFVLTLEQTALIVSQGKIRSAFSAQGKKFIPNADQQAIVPLIINETMGTVEWEGEQYFFMHMRPFPFARSTFFCAQSR